MNCIPVTQGDKLIHTHIYEDNDKLWERIITHIINCTSVGVVKKNNPTKATKESFIWVHSLRIKK